MKIRTDVALGQFSDVGLARTANEDYFGYWEPEGEREFDLKGRLAVVCDGMGGHAGGEIASRMAVKTILEEYEKDTSANVMEALRRSIECANEAVFDEAHKPNNARFKGMGTTVTAVVQRRDVVYFGQVGDSRAYLIRGGAIQQMTKDHSLVQQLVDEGLLDESEMESHPDKNVILRSLGVKKNVEVDISYAPLAPGDIYLLCSDGLSSLVSSSEMLEIVNRGLEQNLEMTRVCQQLIDLANSYGGHDNVTVQLLRVKDVPPASTDATPDETVTQSFTSEEVAASIQAAKAEAAQARAAAGSDVGSGAGSSSDALAVSGSGENPSAAATPAAPSLPRPQAVPKPPGNGSGGGTGLAQAALVIGIVLGAGAGALGVYAFSSPPRTGQEEAAKAKGDAKSARLTYEAKASDPVSAQSILDRAQDSYSRGEKAFDAKRFSDAQAHFETARTLYRLAGSGGRVEADDGRLETDDGDGGR